MKVSAQEFRASRRIHPPRPARSLTRWPAPRPFGNYISPRPRSRTDPDDIEHVTVTATRTVTKLSDAPATVSVPTSDVIEERLAQDIKDLVRFEPGVAVRTSPSRFTAAGAATGRDGHSGFQHPRARRQCAC